MDRISLVQAGFTPIPTEKSIKETALANIERWLNDPELEQYVAYIDHLIETENYLTLLDSFWRMMPFGTGGRRGAVGAGPNRINPYTLNLSVQGHCDYLKKLRGNTNSRKTVVSVVLAYDVRSFGDIRGLYKGVKGVLDGLSSREMAKMAATTYAANGIVSYLVGPLENVNGSGTTDKFVSTPELSFLIRDVGADGGLNVSASHNHPDDNGGKFYSSHGGQEIPPNDEKLLDFVENVDEVKTTTYSSAVEKGLIRIIDDTAHDKYISLNKKICPESSRNAKIAYTPLCGTGNGTVRETLVSLGFEIVDVPEQAKPDGSFSSVKYRIGNPEVPESMNLLKKVAIENDCDVGFATDPDADRLGMIARTSNGDYKHLGGNDLGVLLLQSIISTRKKAGTIPQTPLFINTLVTTSLQRKIALENGCKVVGDLMVGFKYMANVLMSIEEYGRYPKDHTAAGVDSVKCSVDDFLFTCEESHGYLLTNKIRDKDACGAAVQLAGLASILKDSGVGYFDYLRNIYRVYGYFANDLRSLVMEGITGLERISTIQKVLRSAPPKNIGSHKVTNFIDNHVVGGPLLCGTDASNRNVLLFELELDSGRTGRVVVRPSGTEPKTKIYVEVPTVKSLGGNLDEKSEGELREYSDLELDEVIADADSQAREIGNEFIKYCLGSSVLGDVYSEIPDESMFVSDMMPVDRRISFVSELLPKLLEVSTKGSSNQTKEWLTLQLKDFGEDPLGLVSNAAIKWIENQAQSGMIDLERSKSLKDLFR